MKPFKSSRSRVLAMMLVFFAAAFLLPASRAGDSRLYLLAAAVPGGMLLLLVLPAGIMPLDRPSLSAALSLCGLGILAPAAILPDEALSQGMRCIISLFFLMAGTVLVRAFRPSLPAAAVVAACALGLLSVPLSIPDTGFSAAEGGTALLLFAVAAFLSLRLRLPALILSLAGLLLLLQNGRTYAAVWCAACVLLFWAVSRSALWSGIALFSAVSLFGGWILFAPGVSDGPDGSFLPLLAALPLFPPESPEISAEGFSGSFFFLLGKQYGVILLICAVLLLVFLLLRGASVSLNARKSFHASLAFGAVLLFGLRMLVFLVSAADLLPFSPGEFPFLTASLPDLCAHFFLLGILSGVSARNETDLSEDTRLSMLAR